MSTPKPILPGFISSTWRGTTRVSDQSQEIGISFDTSDGKTIRLRLPIGQAEALSSSVADAITDYRTRCHADKSDGIRNVEAVKPENGQSVCPPLKSSAACAGDE